MNKQQEFLRRACDQLGTGVELDHEVVLGSGKRVLRQALLKDIGPSRGMLISSSFDEIEDSRAELIAMGYGYSVYSSPLPHQEFDIQIYREMFEDWNGGREVSG